MNINTFILALVLFIPVGAKAQESSGDVTKSPKTWIGKKESVVEERLGNDFKFDGSLISGATAAMVYEGSTPKFYWVANATGLITVVFTVPKLNKRQWFLGIYDCRSPKGEQVIAIVDTSGPDQPKLPAIKAWKYDTANKVFKKINSKEVYCNNEGYGV